jgi:hypothetical protein
MATAHKGAIPSISVRAPERVNALVVLAAAAQTRSGVAPKASASAPSRVDACCSMLISTLLPLPSSC